MERKIKPLARLSIDLEATYYAIEKIHSKQFTERERIHPTQLRPLYDDERNDYIFREGEVWNERFKTMRRLGKGSFGQVFEFLDIKANQRVAIKVIKNRKSFYNQALMEIRILELLNQKDFDNSRCIVRMKENFIHCNHLCIVYELLSVNLYEVIKAGGFSGLSLNLVKKIGGNILQSLQLLSRSDIQVIHCDLKPENILLCDPRRSAVKVIDFGSSCFLNERAYTYIQSRFYRSPEVILGHPYTAAIDIWSLGCILYELFSGEPLFNGQTEHDQLLKIIDLIGLPPRSMLVSASPQKLSSMFRPIQINNLGTKSFEPIIPVSFHTRNMTLSDLLHSKFQKCLQDGKNINLLRYSAADGIPVDAEGSVRSIQAYTAFSAEFEKFRDLLERMLEYDPTTRITPDEALHHPFFAKNLLEKEGARSGGAAAGLVGIVEK